ncbi:MAG: hypothetical protein WCT36_02130 [Candidatus Gracilibacteria bacterium]
MNTVKRQSMFMPARLVFAAPGETAAKASDAAVEAQAAAPAEGDKNPADKAAQEAAIRAKATKELEEARAGVKPGEAASQKPVEQSGAAPTAAPTVATTAAAPATAPAATPAQTPAASAADAAKTLAAKSRESLPPAERPRYDKFKESFVGSIALMFAEGDTDEAKEASMLDTYKGKGAIGALAAVLGLGALSPMIGKIEGNSPKTKDILDKIRDFFAGLIGGGFEKLSGTQFDDMAKNLKTFDKNVEIDDAVKVPDKKRLVLSKGDGVNDPASIELPKEAASITVVQDGKDIKLKGGETLEAKGADIIVASGITFPKGTKFSKGGKFEDVPETPKAA